MNITSIASRPLVRVAAIAAAVVIAWLLAPLAIAQAQGQDGPPPLVLTGPIQPDAKIALAFDGSHPRVIGLAVRRLRFVCQDGYVDRFSFTALSPTEFENVV